MKESISIKLERAFDRLEYYASDKGKKPGNPRANVESILTNIQSILSELDLDGMEFIEAYELYQSLEFAGKVAEKFQLDLLTFIDSEMLGAISRMAHDYYDHEVRTLVPRL